MRLEAIEQTQSPAGKLRLRFENGQTLLVLPSVVAEHGLIPGMSLPEAALDVLRDDAALASAKERAVRILAAAPVTGDELQSRLVQKGESPEHAALAVQWLRELNLLNDAAVAAQIVRSGAAKGYGAARIRQALYQKHVPRELWDEALEALDSCDEAIDAFLQKRFRGTTPDRKEQKKAADALLRRGHRWEDIRRALERYVPDGDFPE